MGGPRRLLPVAARSFRGILVQAGDPAPGVFFALTRSQDFLEYSSETMAGTLLALGLAAMWIGLRRHAAALQATGAFILGCTAWAKLQALPIAVALVAGGLAVHGFGRTKPDAGPRREATLLAAGFLFALVIPLLAIVRPGSGRIGAMPMYAPASIISERPKSDFRRPWAGSSPILRVAFRSTRCRCLPSRLS